MKKNVLVVAAHPDDEVLGCGATIAGHARRGENVDVLIMAEGLTSRDTQRDPAKRHKELQALHDAAHKANRVLGVRSVTIVPLPDNRLDTVPLLDLVKPIEQAIRLHRPSVLYTHHLGDVNVDHRRVHEAVMAAARPVPGQSVKELFYFEVPSSTEWQASTPALAFAPNCFIDASATLALKLKALHCYASEMRPWPHPRSYKAIEHQARWRGACAGVSAAEAFMLGRKVSS